MPFAARCGLLDGEIADRAIKIGQFACGEIEDLGRQAARSRTRLDSKEVLRPAEQVPHFSQLPRQQAAKNRVNVYAGVEIREMPAVEFAVITKLRMIQALTHVRGEGNWAIPANALGNEACKRRGERSLRASFRRRRFQASLLCGLLINISIT